jgi:hypothetical protein
MQPIVRASGVVAVSEGGSAALLDPKRGTYFGVDEVGFAIWQLLAQPQTLDQVVAALLREYDVTLDELREDASAFIGKLEEEGLVTPR